MTRCRADEVICTSDEDVEARVKEITEGRGAWGALDSLGGDMTVKLLHSIRKGGSGALLLQLPRCHRTVSPFRHYPD